MLGYHGLEERGCSLQSVLVSCSVELSPVRSMISDEMSRNNHNLPSPKNVDHAHTTIQSYRTAASSAIAVYW